ncbi:hypothetical protein [Vibrio algicola]|uniref:STAS domain-containing protein n=1 Tax=Vibrio algicola TaxID=2662262 RepID=A0A5Q0TF62_9VIBR|nr:hypothetical protein [Vibrio algicola]
MVVIINVENVLDETTLDGAIRSFIGNLKFAGFEIDLKRVVNINRKGTIQLISHFHTIMMRQALDGRPLVVCVKNEYQAVEMTRLFKEEGSQRVEVFTLESAEIL